MKPSHIIAAIGIMAGSAVATTGVVKSISDSGSAGLDVMDQSCADMIRTCEAFRYGRKATQQLSDGGLTVSSITNGHYLMVRHTSAGDITLDLRMPMTTDGGLP